MISKNKDYAFIENFMKIHKIKRGIGLDLLLRLFLEEYKKFRVKK